jgi:deoxyribodipyrimidine photo-lyase
MFELCNNISDIQIYVGSFAAFEKEFSPSVVYFKEHPFNIGYKGIEESRDWICEKVTGYYPSFFSYWNKVEKQIR